MGIFRKCVLTLISLMGLLGFISCTNDDEIGLDISSTYGKTWSGELGYVDELGNKLHNEISFSSGSKTNHGIGYDFVSSIDGSPYDFDGNHPDGIYKFDWNVTTSILVIKYEKAYFEHRDNTISINTPTITENIFAGKINGKQDFVLRYLSEYSN